MLFVLIDHADSLSLGMPKEINSTGDLTRLFIQCMSVTCVDIFILISGWFGIRPSVKGISKFIFQWLFFAFGIYIAMVVCGRIPFNSEGIYKCILFNHGGYWFICSYLILYILSPILNAGTQTLSRKQFKWMLIFFYVFVFIYSWCFSQHEFIHGYSAICFIGLYLLARYVRIHQPSFASHSKNVYLSSFFIIISINTIILTVAILLHRGGIPTRISMFYETPTTIMAALALIVYFSKVNLSSKAVNWVASSCFAVYLLHTHFALIDVYIIMVCHFFNSHDGVMALLYIGFFVFLTFFISILIDQPRKYLWMIIERVLEKRQQSFN